jgi:hypothetical protein
MAQMLLSWLGPFRYVLRHYSYNVAMWCQCGLVNNCRSQFQRITLWHPHLRMDCFCHSLWLASARLNSAEMRTISWSFGFVKQLGCAKLVVGDETIFTSLDVINCNHMCQAQNASCTLARRSCPHDVRILLCRCSDSQIHGGMIITFLYDSMTVCCLVQYIATTSYSHLKAHNLP